METGNLASLMSEISTMTRDDNRLITIVRGAGTKGTEVINLADWEKECKSYFNRYYRASSIITGPYDADISMDTLSDVCSDNNGQGFVFKDYNIVNHLEFLGYDKAMLERKFGPTVPNGIISYLAYIRQEHTILVCKKIVNGKHTGNIVTLLKYFLTLYNKELEGTGVTVIGVVIQDKKMVEKIVKCDFCSLLSPVSKVFESRATCQNWLKAIKTSISLGKYKEDSEVLYNLAGKVMCFMAVTSWKKVFINKSFPNMTKKLPEQFKQTYLLFTPQQMKAHLSDAKHVVIQGSYGSGKSILGLKKLELILNHITKIDGQDERIFYINFDSKSKLHYQMKNNVKEFCRISSRNIKLTKSICDILESPTELINVFHNSAREDLSAILENISKLKNIRKFKKANFHVIVEEYDGETLTDDEAAKITKLTEEYFQQSNIMILAQPLLKKRTWSVGKETYEREGCMFNALGNFKTVKLEEVLRCSNEICSITKYTQQYVQNKDSVFTTGIDKLKFEQQQQYDKSYNYMVEPGSQISTYANHKTSSNRSSVFDTLATFKTISEEKNSMPNINSGVTDKMQNSRMDLDQAFEKVSSFKKNNTGKNRIVSKFGFICEPKRGVNIDGGIPKLVEFSGSIYSKIDKAVIFLALVLHQAVSESKKTVFLHIADEKPEILRRATQLFLKLVPDDFLYTESIERYLEAEHSPTKMIFSGNFRSVNGLEFDHVLIFTNYSEYYLQYYLPQVITRCTYNLKLVLLPKEKRCFNKGFRNTLYKCFPRNKKIPVKHTVANIITELKKEDLMERVIVADCETCEKDYNCKCFETDKMTFKVHTHSDQYKKIIELTERPDFTDQVVKKIDSTEHAAAT